MSQLAANGSKVVDTRLMLSEINNLKDVLVSHAPFDGKRVRVNLYRRGIFRSCVFGKCRVTSNGVTISAETPLTQGRRCLSQFELTPADVAAMTPSKSAEADFDLRLELELVQWQERIEKHPLAAQPKLPGRSIRRHSLMSDAPHGSGEP